MYCVLSFIIYFAPPPLPLYPDFQLLGQTLKFGRPKAYLGPDMMPGNWNMLVLRDPSLECGLIARQVPGMGTVEAVVGVVDPATKICRELFIGNLPLSGVSEVQLHQFLNSAMVQVQPRRRGLVLRLWESSLECCSVL